MTKKSEKAVDPTKPTGTGNTLFINYDLDDGVKAQLRGWRKTYDARVLDLITDAIAAGYSVSIKQDTFNKCVAAYLFCRDEKNANSGFALTGRGSTGASALMGMLFRHFCVFEQEWPTHNHPVGTSDDVD